MKYENSGWLFEIQWKVHLISLPLLSECLSKSKKDYRQLVGMLFRK